MKAKTFNKITDILFVIGIAGMYIPVMIMIYEFIITAENPNKQRDFHEMDSYLVIIFISLVIAVMGSVRKNR